MRLLFLALFLSILIIPAAKAQTAADDKASAVEGSTTAPRAEILTDKETGTVRIMIDDQPVVTIDSSGMRVAGTVTATSFDPSGLKGLPAPVDQSGSAESGTRATKGSTP